MERQRHGHLADDLAGLIEKLDLKNIVMVGHSTGGGDYLGRANQLRGSPVRRACP